MLEFRGHEDIAAHQDSRRLDAVPTHNACSTGELAITLNTLSKVHT